MFSPGLGFQDTGSDCPFEFYILRSCANFWTLGNVPNGAEVFQPCSGTLGVDSPAGDFRGGWDAVGRQRCCRELGWEQVRASGL